MTFSSRKISSAYGVLSIPINEPVSNIAGGIGVRFYESLAKNGEKLHHMEGTMGETETKAQVRSKAVRIASLLRSKGIKEGHVIVISSKNGLDQTVALLGCWFAGAIAAPLHSDYDYDDLKRAVRMLQPKCAFCGTKSSIFMNRIFLEINIICPIITFADDSRQYPIFRKCYECKEDPNFQVAYINQPDKQPAIIMLTLGTETTCKLVAVSHYNLYLRYSRLIPRFNKSEKLLSFFPLSCTMHVLASCICFDTTLRMIYIKHFTEKSICKHIQHLRIEHMFIDGDLAVKLVNSVPSMPNMEFDLSSLKTIYVAGMPLSTTYYAKICKTFRGVEVNTTYQTVETGMMTVVSQDVFTRHKDKVLSVGKLYPGISIRVVDIATKQILGPDKAGEIQVRSAAVMLGYYRDPETTFKSFSKGFYKTGDVGSYDSDGYVYIRGRISDQITRGDHQFAVQDIEEVLKLNTAVSEVVCFDHEDDIIACVVKKRGQELSATTLLEFAADVLPSYKLPTKVVFRENFPKTILGAVRKYVIKESVIKNLRDESIIQIVRLQDDD